jgi:hypothetical protein
MEKEREMTDSIPSIATRDQLKRTVVCVLTTVLVPLVHGKMDGEASPFASQKSIVDLFTPPSMPDGQPSNNSFGYIERVKITSESELHAQSNSVVISQNESRCGVTPVTAQVAVVHMVTSEGLVINELLVVASEEDLKLLYLSKFGQTSSSGYYLLAEVEKFVFMFIPTSVNTNPPGYHTLHQAKRSGKLSQLIEGFAERILDPARLPQSYFDISLVNENIARKRMSILYYNYLSSSNQPEDCPPTQIIVCHSANLIPGVSYESLDRGVHPASTPAVLMDSGVVYCETLFESDHTLVIYCP